MKKLIVLLSLLLLFSFGFGEIPWGHRYDWQTWESTSIGVDESLLFSVEWGNGWWASSNIGYGTTTDGTDWTWVDLPWAEDGDDSNKRCSTTVTFTIPGTYYYAYRFVKDGETSYQFGSSEWSLNSTTLSAVNTVIVSEGEVPITLASFTAEALQGKVELNWTTESETENAHFLVYRDGEVIAQVEGNGTTSETHSYSYTDTQVRVGVHRYTLADVNYGGVMEMHESVEVEVEAKIEAAAAEFVLNKAYPNPFNPRTAISYQLSAVTDIDLSIFNTGGEKVATLYNGEQLPGQYMHTWDAAGLSSGIYVIRMMAGNVMQSQKIVLMK